MSIKVKQAINKCLFQIESNTFDEDTIRTLLIVSREYIGSEGLIKELAHFIAHPVRNQGIFHKKVNSRYAKLSLIDEQASKLDIREIQDSIKTENDLSDFILGAISVEKIDSKLFKILYSDGLDDVPEDHLIKFTGYNKKEIKDFLDRSYIKREGYHYLSTNSTEKLIQAFSNLPNSQYDPVKDVDITNQLNHAKHLTGGIKRKIDIIQKVIRGVVYFDSVFDTSELSNEIQVAMLQVMAKFDINKKYVKIIKNNADDILLCIMTLLHDCRFVFFDKNEAKVFLSFYLDNKTDRKARSGSDVNEILYNEGVIALYISYKSGHKTTTFPLFVSNLAIHKYLKHEAYKANFSGRDISEIPWTTASRVGGELQLIKDIDFQ
jgi:hypothetical protein